MTAADTLRHAAVWIDGDPLMEAIAAAVYEQCGTHPEQSLTVDDPRNIAAVAATVARQLLGTGEQAEAEGQAYPPQHRWRLETHDPLANEWNQSTAYPDRADALARHQLREERFATWKDGTPVQRRIVRTTTTYTVEPTPDVTEVSAPTSIERTLGHADDGQWHDVTGHPAPTLTANQFVSGLLHTLNSPDATPDATEQADTEAQPPGGFTTRVCRNCRTAITWTPAGDWTHENADHDCTVAALFELPTECHTAATEEPTR